MMMVNEKNEPLEIASEAQVEIGGVPVKLLVATDGTRLIPEEDLLRLFNEFGDAAFGMAHEAMA